MPIFGDNTGGGDTFPCSGDRAVLSKFTAPGDGTIQSVNVIFDSTSSSGASFKGLVYAADGAGGIPGTRLGVGAAVTVPAGGGDLSSGSLSVAISNGVDYWIGGVVSDFQPVFRMDASPSNGSRMEGTTYASPAASWTQAGTTAGQLNAYATYVTGAAPRRMMLLGVG